MPEPIIHVVFTDHSLNSESALLDLLKDRGWSEYDFKTVERYRFSADRKSRLAARLLLSKVVLEIDPEFDFHRIGIGKQGKPYFTNSSISFNWSHSGKLSIAAICADQIDLGIDIEQHKQFDFQEMSSFMTKKERDSILSLEGEALTEGFYHFWTEKESIMKACGLGLHLCPQEISVQNQYGIVQDQPWHLHKLTISKGYSAHLCSSTAEVDIRIKEVNF